MFETVACGVVDRRSASRRIRRRARRRWSPGLSTTARRAGGYSRFAAGASTRRRRRGRRGDGLARNEAYRRVSERRLLQRIGRGRARRTICPSDAERSPCLSDDLMFGRSTALWRCTMTAARMVQLRDERRRDDGRAQPVRPSTPTLCAMPHGPSVGVLRPRSHVDLRFVGVRAVIAARAAGLVSSRSSPVMRCPLCSSPPEPVTTPPTRSAGGSSGPSPACVRTICRHSTPRCS